MNVSCLWNEYLVTLVELDETGRWVTVKDEVTGNYHLAPVDELQGFDPKSVPQVK
jgi:hypothetical protein